MKIFLTLLFCICISQLAIAQQFVQKQFSFRVDSNVVYATDTNYLGYPEILTMHIYKPIGDNNLHRPILVYVHGGSWLAGVPNDYYPSQISQEFVQRGYVVANIQYRMGMHTNPNVTPGVNCPLIAGNGQCAYISDTAEVLRASFRAMQDAKSAIRFMKARSIQDSTCSDAVFISGESAGAFTALGATLLDKQSERFDECNAIANAPTSNSNISFCQYLFNHLPAGQTPHYNRPDLGSVEGKTNLNGFNSKVKGVAAFYGAIFLQGKSKDWLNGTDTPFIYMFHQGNDFVVSCNTARPIMTMNQCIQYVNLGVNDCVPYSNVPLAIGSCDIASYFQSINFKKYKFEFVNNWTGNTLVDCYNTAQAGQGHNIDYVSVRCDSVAKLFSPIAINTIQSCMGSGIADDYKNALYVYPNPIANTIFISLPNNATISKVEMKNMLGQKIESIQFFNNEIHVGEIPSGIYFIEAESNHKKYVARVAKM